MIRTTREMHGNPMSEPAVSELFEEMEVLRERFTIMQESATSSTNKQRDELVQSINSLLRQTRVFLLSAHTQEARETLILIHRKMVDLMLPVMVGQQKRIIK